METTIRVLKVEPGKAPEIVTLTNKLHDLQDAVSIGAPERGLIEATGLEPGVVMLTNEEGKLIGLPPNRVLYGDIICGVFYVMGTDIEGNLCSLPQDALDKYTEIFRVPLGFTPGAGHWHI